MKYTLKPEKAIERFQKVKAERNLWESHWQECADYGLPRKNDIVNRDFVQGQKKGVNILDSTMMDSAELLAGALQGLLTNPNAEFFEMTTGDDDLDNDDEVRMWLQDSVKKMHRVLNNSNFQTEVHELYLDEVIIGTAVMTIEDDPDSVVTFSTRPIGECYLRENRKGLIVEIYRCFKWSAQECAEEFGVENLTPKIKEAYDRGRDDKFEILHCVYKAGDFGSASGRKSTFPWASQYIAVGEKKNLKVKGFWEWPTVTPRWSKISGETYGRSPGMKALPEAKTLNVMTETTIKGAQKVVDPPLQIPDDGFLGSIRTYPGGLNYYRAGSEDMIKPILNDSRIDFGFQTIEMKQRKIRECFYVDQLKLQQGGPQMTATEILQRTEEAMRLLGPMLGRFQSEFLRPLIDRVFGIMARKNMFKPVPRQLSGKLLDVRYSSLIAKAQRMNEGQNIMRTIQAAEPFIMADQSVLDNIDGDKALKHIAKIYGMPQDILRPEEQVAELRKQRNEANAEMAQMQKDQAQADQMSKVLSIANKTKAK